MERATREIVRQRAEHFAREGARLVGRSAVGRVTVQVLNMNEAPRLRLREQLLRNGESD